MPEITPSKYLVQVDKASAPHWHHPDRIKDCVMCGQSKALAEFYAYTYRTRQGKLGTRYESRCKPCNRARRKARSAAHPGMDAAISRRRRQKKPEWYKNYAKAYRASEHGRLNKARLQRLRKARIRAGMGGPENCAAIRDIYREAIEAEKLIAICPLFGLPELGRKLHIDHIIPLALDGLHKPENLRILPAGLNMRKGAKPPNCFAGYGDGNA